MQLDLELYREEVEVSPDTKLSVIDIRPEAPLQTLVFVHGFGGNARQWQYQAEAFTNHYRVLLPDLRGHGRSVTRSNDFSVSRLVADLEAILEARDVPEPFVLIGHSFGGGLITEFALAHPERVSRLVLIATAGEFEIFWFYRLAFQLPGPVLRAVQPLVRNFVRASVPSLKAMYHQTLNPWRGWDKFPRLQQPTLIIMGERDVVFPEAAFNRVGEIIPDAEVVNVGASAHMVMLERRDAVNRALERFVETNNRYSGWRDEPREPGITRLLAERPWLVHYESGVPHTIHIPPLPITRIFDRACERFALRPALVFKGRTLRYLGLRNHVDRIAAALKGLGVTQGTRVMLVLPNTPHLVVAYYAVLELGGVVVMCNPLASEEELVRQGGVAEADLLITLAQFQKKAQAIKGQSTVRHVIYGEIPDYLPWIQWVMLTLSGRMGQFRPAVALSESESRWRTLIRQTLAPQAPEVEVRPEDTAVIQFTGGTTDDPKGVTLSHSNIVANTMQARAWLAEVRDGEEVVLCVIPFSHVYGMTAGMNLAINLGASMVLLPTFDVEEVLEQIKKYQPTFFPGVPAMYVAINNYPNVRRFNVESIRACLSGAAPLPVEVKERFEKLTRGKLVEGYGLSEAGPVTHANPLFGRNKAGSIGIPVPNTEARVVDLNTGVPLPAGEIGELLVRGPQVMQGYWNDPAATAEVLGADGWLRTNDIARMDEDGYFQIISRRQDMWQVDEHSVAFPRDVEEVIYELPEVTEVVVVAVANRPVAFVSVKEGSRVPAKTIIAYCERRLPPDRVPWRVIFVKDFPRSFIGKVLRRELVSQYAAAILPEAGSVGRHLPGLAEEEIERLGD